MSRLSAVVITKNEERNIEDCLRSLDFCDEIIVVDAESSDRTREIAARFTDKVFTHPWQGYAAQKNYAVGLTSSPWVLSVDADERVPASLRQEIEELWQKESSFSAYLIPRKTFHSGRWIRHGGWYPNRLIRLFDKNKGEWSQQHVHESWVSSGPVGTLEEPLYHHSFVSLGDQVERNNNYSSLAAKQLFNDGIEFSLSRLLLKPVSKFLELYVWKRGFLDGYPGYMISVSAAYSVFLKWAKLWEFEREEKAKN